MPCRREGRLGQSIEPVGRAAVSLRGRVALISTGTEDSYLAPEARARREIDRQLQAAGHAAQDADKVNLAAARGEQLIADLRRCDR